jgi:hypothetical protein
MKRTFAAFPALWRSMPPITCGGTMRSIALAVVALAAVQAHAQTRSPAVKEVPFDSSAASAALASAATTIAACKLAGGPTGQGKIQVTFGPTGGVTKAEVVGAPFAGTPAGSCIASKFQSAKVPAFSGSPKTVAKAFSL